MIEVCMEQSRSARTGETGDPRENPPTSGIVRHDSHLRKSGSDPAARKSIKLSAMKEDSIHTLDELDSCANATLPGKNLKSRGACAVPTQNYFRAVYGPSPSYPITREQEVSYATRPVVTRLKSRRQTRPRSSNITGLLLLSSPHQGQSFLPHVRADVTAGRGTEGYGATGIRVHTVAGLRQRDQHADWRLESRATNTRPTRILARYYDAFMAGSAVHPRCTQQEPVTTVLARETECIPTSHKRSARNPTKQQGWGKREIPEKTLPSAASSGTIPTCENPGVARPEDRAWFSLVTVYLQLFPGFETEMRKSDKGDIAPRIKCPIAAKRKALSWRAVFSSHCVMSEHRSPISAQQPTRQPAGQQGTFAACSNQTDGKDHSQSLAQSITEQVRPHQRSHYAIWSLVYLSTLQRHGRRTDGRTDVTGRCKSCHTEQMISASCCGAPCGLAWARLVFNLISTDGNTTRLGRRSDEALGVRVTVARIAPSRVFSSLRTSSEPGGYPAEGATAVSACNNDLSESGIGGRVCFADHKGVSAARDDEWDALGGGGYLEGTLKWPTAR
ncbi:hypothetical protein PR048_017883 [Dryococelus australis]|uniref:Uncharacterized protein n=1 Tax=Dryococelus australis TaxID=614101 RepID=A0ABQ9HAQ5_9NEOP|nr:hypothetical protein PR048_017883 [Dryococelus australis]